MFRSFLTHEQSLQDLSETRVAKLNSLWSTAAQLETDTLSRSTQALQHLSAEIPRNNPLLDSMMFVRHNAAPWEEPADMNFEPSPVWLDEGLMAVDEPATVFLRNVLLKSKGQMGEFRRQLDAKRREVEAGKKVRQLIREGKDKRDEVEVVRSIFALQEAMHDVERQKSTAEVEVLTITAAVGDVSIGAKNHNFKSQTFKIPTNCDLCGERIWGLSAKGFDCSDCGYTCHSKCELKVPADCPGELNKLEKKKIKDERQKAAHATPVANGASEPQSQASTIRRSDTVNSMNTLSSGYSVNAPRAATGGILPPEDDAHEPSAPPRAPPTVGAPRRVLAPPPSQYIKDADGASDPPRSSDPKARMLYAYQGTGDEEIFVPDGKEVIILEPDDGSGWMKVRFGTKEGLVPAAYAEVIPSTPVSAGRPGSTYSNSSISVAGSINAPGTKKKGPAVAPKRGAKKLKYAEAMYDYSAQSDAEHSIAEGERFVLITRDIGDGWADIEKGGQVKSVPANYIQEV
ncbi:hypothetical protein EJ05DRAFT_395388 [Pseudovirgaria hyperparasitica]|uniref:FCH-domain-containing protein n=1 Tax=Pseudovirgaria hyperparasitica TaxID=470096 RepID=A0A6A6W6N1_9PEZI|nr:uncharacterized protein EJ05DRAFT_395388 [Pseudovirgaria hyperparasitica]KAF2757620.1 hypothetical protein EJ05DRAFT_395388 [Pseudovirgaria hyperparasitica]